MTPDDKFTKAKVQLLLREPFYASILLTLRIKKDENIPTMCTDGVSLFWSPKFVDELTLQECMTVLAHEALHCVLLHMYRRGMRDPQGWNVAADFAINNQLDNISKTAKNSGSGDGNFPMPKGALLNHAFDALCAEEIYNQLPKQKKGGKGNQPGNGPGMGDFMDAPGKDPDGHDHKGQIEKWKVAINQAAQIAKMQGKLPAGMERLVEQITNPPAPWTDILRRFVTERAKDDYSWRRPNRRLLHQGFYLPTLDSNRMGRIAIGIDTSGSIGGRELAVFLNECQAILNEVRPNRMTIIQCDAAVHEVRDFVPGDLIARDFEGKGGGGTSFKPVFKELEKDPPVCAVYLTDMMGDFPDHAPEYPVLWAATTDQPAPFGEIVRINEPVEVN